MEIVITYIAKAILLSSIWGIAFFISCHIVSNIIYMFWWMYRASIHINVWMNDYGILILLLVMWQEGVKAAVVPGWDWTSAFLYQTATAASRLTSRGVLPLLPHQASQGSHLSSSTRIIMYTVLLFIKFHIHLGTGILAHHTTRSLLDMFRGGAFTMD